MDPFTHLYCAQYQIFWQRNSQGQRAPVRMVIRTNLSLDPQAADYDENALDDLEKAALAWTKYYNIGALQFLQVFL